ncbi:SIS domain-containing protein [Magnetospira thiophila]
MTLAAYLLNAIQVLDRTAGSLAEEKVEAAIVAMTRALGAGHPMLVCGNGGSAADAMHITGELVGRFLMERRALNCICLASNPAVLTAWSNDCGYDSVFARQVEAHAHPKGVLFGISTSGNSESVVLAFVEARKQGMTTVGLTGEGGGRLAGVSDILLDVPSRHTPDIQQAHLGIYHYICAEIEQRLNR